MRWTIYYGDGTTYTDENGGADTAPALDIQVTLQYHPISGWYMQSGSDYYVWQEDDEIWLGVDIMGLYDYLQRPGWKRVLFGRTIHSKTFQEIYQRVIADRNRLRGL